jgi:hypothetical protein
MKVESVYPTRKLLLFSYALHRCGMAKTEEMDQFEHYSEGKAVTAELPRRHTVVHTAHGGMYF